MKNPFDLTPLTEHKSWYFTIMKFEYDEIATISDDFFLESFKFLKDLETFSLRGNKLKKIPEKFFRNFETINNLDLSQNLFENISDLSFISGKSF